MKLIIVVLDSTSSLAKLGVSSRERWYLLTLKAKYAGMYKMHAGVIVLSVHVS